MPKPHATDTRFLLFKRLYLLSLLPEMIRRRQLFPGSSYIQQMKMIVSLLGSPSKELLKRCNSDQIQHFLRGLGHHAPVPLLKVFPEASGDALDLLTKILVLDPGVSLHLYTLYGIYRE